MKISSENKKNIIRGGVFLLLAFLFFLLPEIHHYRDLNSRSEQVDQAASKIKALSEKLDQTLSNVSTISTENDLHNTVLHGGFERDGFSFYGLKDHRIFFWSANDAVVNNVVLDTIHSTPKARLGNGDYLVEVLEKGNTRWVGLLLLKKNFPYENKYLQNEFNPAILPCGGIETSEGIPLLLPDGSVGYKIQINSGQENWSIFSFALSILFFFFSLFFLLSGRSLSITMLALGLLLGWRLLMIHWHVPDDIYNLSFFTPQDYASSLLFNSPGDLLINAALFLLFSIHIYRNSATGKPTAVIKILFLVAWIGVAIGLHLLLYGLVINSRISFDVANPASIDAYSLLAFAVAAVLLISFLFFTGVLLRLFGKDKENKKYAGLAFLFLAFYASVTLQSAYREKELDNRKVVAHKADMRQDHVAEYLFEEAEKKISNDPAVKIMLSDPNLGNEKISSYVLRNYFSGYLSRYEIAVYAFDSLGNCNGESVRLSDIRARILSGKVTYSDKLYFISNETGGGSYIGIIPFDQSASTLVVSLDAHFFQSEEGFPELFISGRFNENYSIGDYSIARYKNNSLVYEFGNYVYGLSSKDFPKGREEFQRTELNGYDHLIYRINSDSLLIVSKPREGVFSLLTLFSWLFTAMLTIAFLLFLLSYMIRPASLMQVNLTGRIQSSVLFLVVLSFVLIGAGTTIYINRKYVQDQKKSIGDQVNALWFRISELNVDPDSLAAEQIAQLERLAANTNINFNLFNREGSLIYTSQPKIYENGILAPLMDPEAFFEIREKGVTQFIHPEHAGKLNFISAYAPVPDSKGSLSAFLNLPYLEKQNELNKEISGFLSALLNIYVILFAVAVLITLIISSRITKPLLLIQEKMSEVKIGHSNEQIEYAGNDEIGSLVKEYNRMLKQLEISADKLAQSERESAWREMARQVAHEIKNPLTPMKLSIQHLQLTTKEKGQTDPEMISRISENLIQQIDTLANIATAFSDFAKLPQAKTEKVDVQELLHQLTGLYSELPGIQITLEVHSTDPLVSADKDQLIRIFNNILKNATQAIPEGKDGRITVRMSDENGFLTVDIEDNGIGIPEDQREKIFKPNFTTKSGGMGLGLAMVKNMVQSMNGNISYSSEYGKGTNFTVRLPKMG